MKHKSDTRITISFNIVSLMLFLAIALPFYIDAITILNKFSSQNLSSENMFDSQTQKISANNSPIYQSIAWMNRNLSNEDTVLVQRGSDFAYYAKPRMVSMIDPAYLQLFLAKSKNDLLDLLELKKISYFYQASYSTPAIYNTQFKRLLADPSISKLVYYNNGVRVWKFQLEGTSSFQSQEIANWNMNTELLNEEQWTVWDQKYGFNTRGLISDARIITLARPREIFTVGNYRKKSYIYSGRGLPFQSPKISGESFELFSGREYLLQATLKFSGVLETVIAEFDRYDRFIGVNRIAQMVNSRQEEEYTSLNSRFIANHNSKYARIMFVIDEGQKLEINSVQLNSIDDKTANQNRIVSKLLNEDWNVGYGTVSNTYEKDLNRSEVMSIDWGRDGNDKIYVNQHSSLPIALSTPTITLDHEPSNLVISASGQGIIEIYMEIKCTNANCPHRKFVGRILLGVERESKININPKIFDNANYSNGAIKFKLTFLLVASKSYKWTKHQFAGITLSSFEFH